MPDLDPALARRIRLVRRDVSDLLFHFTRGVPDKWVEIVHSPTHRALMPSTAKGVLHKILHDGALLGSSSWTYGKPTVCFTEAPIHEFNSIFSLNAIAASNEERPRYEPYGIAVPKTWLFQQGGRPVIYDHPSALNTYPDELRYRFTPYDPSCGKDYTWEREWRIETGRLVLDPKHALVIVPRSDEAFDLVYGFSEEVPDWDVEGSSGPAYVSGSYHQPKWLAVSLDLFGIMLGENGT